MSQNKAEFMAGEKVELNCSTDLAFTMLEWLDAGGKSLANSSSSFLIYSFNINKPEEQLTCRTGTGSGSQNMTLTLRLKVRNNVDDSDSLGVIAGGVAAAVIAIVIVTVMVLIVIILVAIGRRFVPIECP